MAPILQFPHITTLHQQLLLKLQHYQRALYHPETSSKLHNDILRHIIDIERMIARCTQLQTAAGEAPLSSPLRSDTDTTILDFTTVYDDARSELLDIVIRLANERDETVSPSLQDLMWGTFPELDQLWQNGEDLQRRIDGGDIEESNSARWKRMH